MTVRAASRSIIGQQTTTKNTMSYTKIIQSIVIVACGVLYISQAQAKRFQPNTQYAVNCIPPLEELAMEERPS